MQDKKKAAEVKSTGETEAAKAPYKDGPEEKKDSNIKETISEPLWKVYEKAFLQFTLEPDRRCIRGIGKQLGQLERADRLRGGAERHTERRRGGQR